MESRSGFKGGKQPTGNPPRARFPRRSQDQVAAALAGKAGSEAPRSFRLALAELGEQLVADRESFHVPLTG